MSELPHPQLDDEQSFTSETEPTELEQFREVVHEKLVDAINWANARVHQPSTEEEIQQLEEISHKYSMLSDILSSEDRARILNEERMKILNIPEGMNLSSRAMELVEKQWKKYRMEFQLAPFRPDRWLRQKIDLLNPWTNGADGVLFCYDHDEIVGVSSYEICRDKTNDRQFMYVMYQGAKSEQPGAGLAMLQQLVEKARELGLSHVELMTLHLPLGLGNLGFYFVPGDGRVMSMVHYRLDLEPGES